MNNDRFAAESFEDYIQRGRSVQEIARKSDLLRPRYVDLYTARQAEIFREPLLRETQETMRKLQAKAQAKTKQ